MYPNLYAVIVLYNMKLTDSITYNNLMKIKNYTLHIIVVDNSTNVNSNKELCNNNQIIYISMHGNAGLSKAYNKVLDYLSGKEGIVIWFDDDTNVTQEYFDKLVASSKKYPEIDIFTPIIEGQDGKFWSPNKARFFKNKQLRSINEKISNSEYNAINSCTAARLRIFENYRYDERLFLDQVDHSFCRDQRKRKRKFLMLDCVIHHNFSTKNKLSSIKKLKKRYSLMIPDFLTYCDIDKFHLKLGYIKVLGWGVREGIKYRNLQFLPWCINQIYMWKRRN